MGKSILPQDKKIKSERERERVRPDGQNVAIKDFFYGAVNSVFGRCVCSLAII